MLNSERRSSQRAFYTTVCSGKGGVGKSTISLLLAIRMANKGYRTLLIDGDFGLGDLATMCNATLSCGFESLVSNRTKLENTAAKIGPRLWLLGTEMGSDFASLHADQDALQSLRQIDSLWDAVIIDTASALDHATLTLMSESDLCITVTSPHVPAIADSYIQLKQAFQLDGDFNPALIVNKADSEIEGDQAATKFCELVKKFLNRPVHVLGSVGLDPHVEKAAEKQSISLIQMESSGAVRKLDRIVKVLEEKHMNRSRSETSLWERLLEAMPLKRVVAFDDTQLMVHN